MAGTRRRLLDRWAQALDGQDLRIILTLLAVVFLLSAAVNLRRIGLPTDNDYSLHVLYAQMVADGKLGDLPLNALAHPALQFILAGMHFLTFKRLGLYASLMVVQTLAQVLTALILYFWLGSGGGRRQGWLRAFWAGSLTIVAPVMLMAIWDGKFYFGYVGLANYHNPTIHLLRPLALLSFVYALRAFEGAAPSRGAIAISAGLVALSALVKPNFVISMLPALGGMCLLQLYRRQPIRWNLLLGGFVAPGLLILALQWFVGFWLARGEQVGVLFRPFEVESAGSDYLAPKLLLSVLFPLVALLINWRRMAADRSIRLAWLAFLAGAAQMYLLAEGGDRFYHGNFRWSAQITLFLLFAASARWLLRSHAGEALGGIRRAALPYAAYLAHLVAGIAYYLRSLMISGYG